jgi:hypothetical protein
MRFWILLIAATLALIASVQLTIAEERVTANGRIFDAAGKPLQNATVMVYSAGVKKGYSLFCPTCYKDCGKRTVSGADGSYTIGGLDPELSFTFVAVKDGYFAVFISKVDPAAGPAPDVRLKPTPSVSDSSQVVRGRIVDGDGKPLRGALIEPDIATYRDNDGRIHFSAPVDWINELTVTNEKGDFELAFTKSVLEMTFRVTARSMAPGHFTLPAGPERKTVILTEGAVIRGRLVYKGKPVPNAELRLIPHDTGVGRWYPEVRIGTAEDGRFSITNVPPRRIWLLHPTMESLAARGMGGDLIECETKADGDQINLGDISLKPAHTLRGKFVLMDTKHVPADMRATITADRSQDSQTTKISPDGEFQFNGLPDGIYSVAPSVEGYRLLHECTASLCRSVEIAVHHDVSDLVIQMEPEPGSAPRQ